MFGKKHQPTKIMPTYTAKKEHEQSGDYIREAGTYKLRVDAIREKFTDHDIAELTLVDVESGRKMTENLHFTPKAMFRVMLFAKACGHPPIHEGESIEVNEGNFKGKTLTAKVVMEENESTGKSYAGIAEFDVSDYPHKSLIIEKNESPKEENKW